MSRETPPEERPILRKVENGLQRAVEDDPDLDWTTEGTRIRRQKYTEQAVAYFTQDDDEPVLTSSWYKFGKTYPAAPSGADFPDDFFRSPRLRASEIYAASVDDIAHFFTYEADRPKLDAEHWYMDSLSFLERFYRLQAPERYRELYLANIELRRVLSDTADEVSSLRQSQTGPSTSLGDFGGGQIVDYYRRVGRVAAHLHMELVTLPELEVVLDPVREYTNLVEDVLMQLAKVDQSDLSTYHRTVLDSLEAFYDEEAWEFVASVVMQETAEGPNSDWVVDQADGNLSVLRETYRDHLGEQRGICGKAGLLPGPADYPKHEDDVDAAIQGLMRTIDRTDE